MFVLKGYWKLVSFKWKAATGWKTQTFYLKNPLKLDENRSRNCLALNNVLHNIIQDT